MVAKGKNHLKINGEAMPGFASIAHWSENKNFGSFLTKILNLKTPEFVNCMKSQL